MELASSNGDGAAERRPPAAMTFMSDRHAAVKPACSPDGGMTTMAPSGDGPNARYEAQDPAGASRTTMGTREPMIATKSPEKRVFASRLVMPVFYVCFLVFVTNILLGKATITFGWEELPLLGDVAEFLLLLFTMIVFVIAALLREQARAKHDEDAKT
jgi:hypothetical protein